MVEQMDKCIEDAWLHASEDAFSQILYFVHTENVPVDYQVSWNFVVSLSVPICGMTQFLMYKNCHQHLL